MLRSLHWSLLCRVIVETLFFFLTCNDPWPTSYIIGNVILTLVTTVMYGHTDHGRVVVGMEPNAVAGAGLTSWWLAVVPSRAGFRVWISTIFL